MSSAETDAVLAAAVRLFNDGQYLAAHEVLDELWEGTLGPEADFYKGLIQASIALHHLEGGNRDGARKLERGTRALLASYLPTHRDLDLATLLQGLRAAVRGDDDARVRLEPPV